MLFSRSLPETSCILKLKLSSQKNCALRHRLRWWTLGVATDNVCCGCSFPDDERKAITIALRFGTHSSNGTHPLSAGVCTACDDDDGRVCILSRAKSVKKLFLDYMPPEIGITFVEGARNFFTCATNYGNRKEIVGGDAQILAKTNALKKLAMDYMHLEVGAKVISGACCGRDCFAHPSAPDTNGAAMLKKSPTNYL